MPSIQRFLSGRDNLLRNAVLTASSVAPSTAIERVRAIRAGGGRVRLAGDYVGHEATAVEVEIAAAAGVPRASVPQFVGVGNGQLSVHSVDAGATLQTLTLTLADLGVPTEHAQLTVREVIVRARSAGAAGNALRITVTPALTRSATEWALLAEWPVGQATQRGEQWDFGALPLSPAGELDPASGRVQFGTDPTIYRLWREYKDGGWQFGVSPALERSIPAGTRVWSISGGYTVDVTDGTSTETFTGLVTFYDALTALQSSTLVDVMGVVAADRRPGGQAAVDIPLRTGAWLRSTSGKVSLEDVSVPAAAPTQAVTVRCINADVVGRERWSVAGTVSGALATAITGELFTSTAASFRVPAKAADTDDSGEWAFKYEPTTRNEGEGLPSVCVRPLRFGRNARPRSVTFRYQLRPPADCQCSTMPTPLISLRCLGLEDDMSNYDPAYLDRVKSVYAWRETFVRANTTSSAGGTTYVPGTPGTPETPGVPPTRIYSLSGRATYTSEGLLYSVDFKAVEEFSDSAAADAAVTALEGQTIPAGTAMGHTLTVAGVSIRITWMGRSLYTGNPVLTTAEPAVIGQPAVESYFSGGQSASPGTPGTPGYSIDEPPHFRAWERDLDWADAAVPILLGCLTEIYEHSAALALWDTLWAEVQSDMSILFGNKDDLGAEPKDRNARYLDRYRATVDNIYLEAGIVPKSDASGAGGDSCWRDYPEETHWWVDTAGYYLPAFNNKPYISARRNTETGVAYSTMEFGFGLVVACPDRLKTGDTLTVSLLSVDAQRPYQVGDEAVIETVAAGPAWLTGGVDGTDVQTWRVTGSVSGVLPDYIVPTDGTPAPLWAAAGVELRMSLAGIPFSLGDQFTLAVEAGQYRWRRDGGLWSALLDIPDSGAAQLADGLSVLFEPGAAPSFVPGDAYAFAVHQPHAVSHVRSAHCDAWRWQGDTATLVIDMGSVQPIQAIALARYTLPAGAGVVWEVSADGAAWSAAQALDVSRAVCVQFVDLHARYLRVRVEGAAGGAIGWVWLGVPFATDHHASRCTRNRRWAATRGGGLNPVALYAGAGDGWSLGWSPGDETASRLLEQDIAGLLPLLDWAQTRDEPLLFVPHHRHPQDAALVRFAADALEIGDVNEYQSNDRAARYLSAALELEPVYA